jgi:type II restriction/modification system DNA methylase subunit YeeA
MRLQYKDQTVMMFRGVFGADCENSTEKTDISTFTRNAGYLHFTADCSNLYSRL